MINNVSPNSERGIMNKANLGKEQKRILEYMRNNIGYKTPVEIGVALSRRPNDRKYCSNWAGEKCASLAKRGLLIATYNYKYCIPPIIGE